MNAHYMAKRAWLLDAILHDQPTDGRYQRFSEVAQEFMQMLDTGDPGFTEIRWIGNLAAHQVQIKILANGRKRKLQARFKEEIFRDHWKEIFQKVF